MPFEYVDEKSESKFEYVGEKKTQTKSILPTVGQVVGGIGGGILGGMAGHPYIGANIGGIVGRGLGHLKEQQNKSMALSMLPPPFGEALTPFVSGFSKEKSKQIQQDMNKTALLQTATMPLAYGLGKGIQYVGKLGTNLPKILSTKKGSAFAEKIREAFISVKQKAVEKFGGQLDKLSKLNPTKTVSLRNEVDDLVNNLSELPNEVKSVFRRTPHLGKMLDDPSLANDVSLSRVQEIINYIQTKIPATIKSKHIDILDTLSDIKAAQLRAFPEMAKVRAEYAQVAEPFKNVRNYFKFNKILKGIESNFGGAEGKKAVESLLPKSVIKQMGGYKTTINTLKVLRRALPWIPAALGLGYMGSKAFNKFSEGEE